MKVVYKTLNLVMYAMYGFLYHFYSLCVSATDPGTDTVSTVDLGNGVRQDSNANISVNG